MGVGVFLAMKNIFFSLIFCFISSHIIKAQALTTYHAALEVQETFSSPNVPFWLRSNQFGSVPLSGKCFSLIPSLWKMYRSDKKHLSDFGFSIQPRFNIGKKGEAVLIEGYAKVRMSIFELKAGRSKEIMGLVDTTLSSGAFSISGNTLGIPKVELSIPQFYSLPIFGGLFAFKGNYAHGWLGAQPIQNSKRNEEEITYFHQASFYGRFGKPSWRLKLFGGFNHNVFWGNENHIWGGNWELSKLKTYEYVVLGKTSPAGVEKSKVGNHLGSIDLAIGYNFNFLGLLVYRQSFYDAGALGHLGNIADGLNGLSITNLRPTKSQKMRIDKILLEVLYTLDQAGKLSSKVTPSGDENYYNNYVYTNGWSYKGSGLGNPLLASAPSVKKGFPNWPEDYFIDNRVLAFHLGIQSSFRKWRCLTKITYSENYGTYGTSPIGHSLAREHYAPIYGLFKKASQWSFYAEIKRKLIKKLSLGLVGAFDCGELYYNSGAVSLRIYQSF